MRAPHISWRPNGQAYRLEFDLIDCPEETKTNNYRTDEYGSSVRCPSCGSYGGHQTIAKQRWMRAPEYDAPEPGSLEGKNAGK